MDTEQLEVVRNAHSQIRKALEAMDRGPFDYYLNQLAIHSEALLTKFAPIKKGARAVIKCAPECKNGWSGCEDTLAVGRIGTVRDVGYDERGFYFTWVPDFETYKNHEGRYLPSTSVHSYGLRETHLTSP